MRDYICFNGAFIKAGECLYNAHFLPFIHTLTLTENIRCIATEPLFLEMHISRIGKNLSKLDVSLPPSFTVENMRMFINRLLNKNRIYGGAHVKLTVSVSKTDGLSFLLDGEKLEDKLYTLNEKGLCIDVCQSVFKPTGVLSGIRFSDPMYFKVEQDLAKSGMDDLILLNEANRMVECSHSNIFLISGKSVFTPGLSHGCIPGIMRSILLRILVNMGYGVHDDSSLTPSALLDAEEVFLSDTIEGVRWVGAYKQVRYFNKTSKLLVDLLNTSLRA